MLNYSMSPSPCQEEATIRNQLIDNLEASMGQARDALKNNWKMLKKAYKQSSSSHLIFLVLFCLGIFVFVYILAKMGKFAKIFGI